ncbi:hypothetical protein [Chitinibacter sp. GC72]|uniref:hypothetical protein n=1 Tax=Chitinibacter sp. GC72 TaxID=1526917 RepID=UPI0012F7686F|nr:hypothetical protein [Chitinibacter sp. GC72]
MITIKIDQQQIKQLGAQLERKVLRCTAIAMTKTAYHAKAEAQAEMRRVFDRPTRFTLNSMRVRGATYQGGPQTRSDASGNSYQIKSGRTNLSASVEFQDAGAAGHWIAVQATGGLRHMKRFELALQARGALPSGYQVVPARGAPLDAYGNISRGFIMKVISQLGTELMPGYSNTSKKEKVIAANKRRNGTFFVMLPGNKQRLPPGIYQGIQGGLGWKTRMVLAFVRPAVYQRRLDIDGVGQRAVDRHFEHEFSRAFGS